MLQISCKDMVKHYVEHCCHFYLIKLTLSSTTKSSLVTMIQAVTSLETSH